MNDTIKNILERRSVRSYEPTPVPREILEQIVQCGMYAANGMGLQPWHFTVVGRKDILEQIAARYRDEISDPRIGSGRQGYGDPNFDCLWGAPAAIIVSGESEGFYVAVDCANAMQNMAVAATSLGLGSCFVAHIKLPLVGEKGKWLKNELGIPEDFVPYFVLAVGYSNEEPGKRDERRQDAVNFVE